MLLNQLFDDGFVLNLEILESLLFGFNETVCSLLFSLNLVDLLLKVTSQVGNPIHVLFVLLGVLIR